MGVISRYIKGTKSVFTGISVLIGLFIIGSLTIPGFLTLLNMKSMLVFAAFLGLATVGQTFVALLGGLDLSIPFVIGSSNVALMSLISKGVPPWLACLAVLILGLLIGLVNGILSFRLQGQALILTLGVGFFVKGGVQILVAMGTFSAGTVFGVVPQWMINLAAMNGKTIGLPIPPVIIIWIVASILIIVGLRLTKWGRHLYALGGSRLSSSRLSISERGYWIGAYVISGFFASLTGILLLWLEWRRFYRSWRYIFIYNFSSCCNWRNIFIRWLWRIWIKCNWSINITDYNDSANWMGFKLGSSTIHSGIINYSNGGSYARSPHIRSQI